MLTKKEIFYLKTLNKMFPYGKLYDDASFYDSKVGLSNVSSDACFSEFAEICRSLEESGYIRDLSINLTETVKFLQLTHLGRSYQELQRLEAWKVLTERWYGFALGIASSVAAYFTINAIIALLLKSK